MICLYFDYMPFKAVVSTWSTLYNATILVPAWGTSQTCTGWLAEQWGSQEAPQEQEANFAVCLETWFRKSLPQSQAVTCSEWVGTGGLNQVYCVTTGVQENYQNDNEKGKFFCTFTSSRKLFKCHSVPQTFLGRSVTLWLELRLLHIKLFFFFFKKKEKTNKTTNKNRCEKSDVRS